MASSVCRRLVLCAVALLLSLPKTLSAAENQARFDLMGPRVQVHVTRAGKTLPIASVPNLKAGDQLWVHADLPETQSVRYLLVVIFLRGTTNPPPESWFTRIETWNRRTNAEGTSVIVPAEAQQALLLLAPETGGDFSALRSAVRGHPGVFVRASQDLAEAGFEQARIEKYLTEMRSVSASDPKALAQHSELLARTLNLKPNADCFSKPVDQQYNCLTQSGTQNLLDDGHGQSIVASLTSGASSDLITQASSTSLAGGGVYSAYVGAIVDMVRIMSGLRTAHYSYIPAIAFPEGEDLKLRLNTPPSFQNPKSVIVIGLPSVQAAVAPPLRAADPKHVACLLQPKATLLVEGAPLVFSTGFAHDLSLHFNDEPGAADLPLQPDAFQGGLTIGAPAERKPLTETESGTRAKDAAAPKKAAGSVPVQETATVHGMWGFDSFSGPTLPVQRAPGSDWKFSGPETHIIVGEQNHIYLTSTGTACIQAIAADNVAAGEQKVEWKPGDKPNTLDVSLTLKSASPGALSLSVHQFGKAQPDGISAQTFAKAADLKSVEYHLGDHAATLSGTNLGQVQSMQLAGATLTPVSGAGAPDESVASGLSSLRMRVPDGAAATQFQIKPGERQEAKVTLQDGRVLTLPVVAQSARPTLSILNMRVQRDTASPITLLNEKDVPLNSRLILSMRSGDVFPRDSQVEIASEDRSLHHVLSVDAGTLVLLDRKTVLAQVDLRKTFGDSAFGPLQVRIVTHDGVPSDWEPLANLVRLPDLTDVHCTGNGSHPCTLSGNNLYLIAAVGVDQSFANQAEVPDGFVGPTVEMAHPAGDQFYLKLRDDPASVASVKLPVTP